MYLFFPRRKKYIDAYFSNFVFVLAASKMKIAFNLSFPFILKRQIMTHTLILRRHTILGPTTRLNGEIAK